LIRDLPDAELAPRSSPRPIPDRLVLPFGAVLLCCRPMPIRVLDMTIPQLRLAVEAVSQPAYRAAQIADWVYGKGVHAPAAMANLPSALREGLVVVTSRVAERRESTDGTLKLLIELSDGEQIEAVRIPAEGRATACLSTQVGCAFRCAFCATGQAGLRRNLSASEILEQLLHLRTACGGERISNVVFMGMGEPLANYDATVAAVRALIDPERFGLSARSVTVSTLGIPKAIRRLAAEDLPVTLAISLHAPNDALRRRLLPRAPGTIDEVLRAARRFYEARHREVTLEYVLLAGVNDTPLCAEGLARLAKSLRCSVNLIRYNPVSPLGYDRPSQSATKAFAARLKGRGVNVHVRRSRGLDADAACGQLRTRRDEQTA